MIKIAFINAILEGGGIEKLLGDIVNRLDKNIFDITVFTTRQGINPNKIFKDHIKYDYLYKNITEIGGIKKYTNKLFNQKFKIFNSNNEFIKKINKGRFDIAVSMKEGLISVLVSKTNAKIKIAWVLTDVNSGDSMNNYIKKSYNELVNAYSLMKKIIICTNTAKHSFEEVFGILTEYIVIPNLVPETEVIFRSNEKVSNIAKPKDKLLFICVGRLSHEKGQELLIRSCKLLNDMDYKNKYELWLVGNGKDRNMLEQYVERYMLSNIKFIGYQDNPYKYMKLADVLVLPSKTEGFGLVITEAMFLGIPIIATNSAGPSEILDNGRYGILTDIDSKAIAEGMKTFLDDNSKLNKYKNLSIERSKKYSEENILSKINAVLIGENSEKALYNENTRNLG